METETIIIDVQLSDDQVAKKLSDTTAEIARLKNEQKQLSQFIKAGADKTGELSKQYAENSQRLRELTAEEKTYTAQLNTTTSEQREYGDSVYQLSARLADLKNQYRGLSKEQRESASGQELKNTIQDLDKEVKSLDADLGDHQRNVGNYVSALTGLDNRVVKVAAVFQGGFRNGLASAGAALKSFGKTLLATPIGWIAAAVAAVIAVFKQLRDAFKRNDEASTELSASMARLQPIITGIRKIFEGLANVVAKVVSGITAAASAVIGFLVPSFREASKEAENLVRAEDALEDKQREYTVASAERQRQISELNKKARADEKLTAKQREDIYRQIDELERKDMEERKRIAAENLRIIEAKYKKEVDKSDEAKNALAAARAEMLKTETDYNNATLRIAQRQAAAVKEQAEEAKRRHEEWKRRQRERVTTTREALQALEDLRLEFIKDEVARERAEMSVEYGRRIEALKERLKNEQNLTVEARKAIEEQIILLQRQYAERLDEINRDEIQRRFDKEVAERERLIDLRISMMKNQDEREIAQAQEQGRRIIEGLKRRLEEEGDLTEAAKAAIREQIELQEQLTQDRITEIQRKALEERIEAEKKAREETAKQLDELLKKQLQAANEAITTFSDAARTANEAMTSLYNSIAGDSVEYENFRKAMAIVDATISLGEAIAKATLISMEGDPYTVSARIAANVAAITAQFASLIATIKAATIPSAPAFAQGGIVGGNSITGDTVMVRANTGEMFINREDQRRLLDMIQSGAIGGGYETVRAAMADALKEMPAPVLDYSEFTGFQRSVKMIERRTKL